MNPDFHEDVDEDVYEHGRCWAVCRACGAQWAIDGSEYEQVKDGDGSCEDTAVCG
jgi:hypothetical protein